jgi:hypothetical protein
MQMRSLWLIGAALVLAGCATTAPAPSADETIEVALEAPGVPKERIFDATKAWFTDKLRAESKSIEYENRQEAALVATATLPYPCEAAECIGKHGWEVPLTMRVDIKDARFTVSFSKIRLTWPEISYRSAYSGPVRPYGNWDKLKAHLQGLGAEIQQAAVGAPRARNREHESLAQLNAAAGGTAP